MSTLSAQDLYNWTRHGWIRSDSPGSGRIRTLPAGEERAVAAIDALRRLGGVTRDGFGDTMSGYEARTVLRHTVAELARSNPAGSVHEIKTPGAVDPPHPDRAEPMSTEAEEPMGVRYLCAGRGPAPDPHDTLQRWIADQAQKQDRCPLCLTPRAEGCGVAEGDCRRPLASDAQAVAILRGMVRG